MSNLKHWTQNSVEDYEYRIASDFVELIYEVMETRGISQELLASRLGKTAGRISQIFNNPGNLTLRTMCELSASLGLSLSVVPYEDDLSITYGPVDAALFRDAWEFCGKPRTKFDMDRMQLQAVLEKEKWQSLQARKQTEEYLEVGKDDPLAVISSTPTI